MAARKPRKSRFDLGPARTRKKRVHVRSYCRRKSAGFSARMTKQIEQERDWGF